MVFNSFRFLFVFLPVTAAACAFLPRGLRPFLLLIASYVFCAAWNWPSAVALLIATVVDYSIAIGISRAGTAGKRLLLLLSIVANVAFVWYSRYALSLVGMLGVSFYTFKKMSYVVDVYRGVIAPERRFHLFALYVAFFPSLVAGPIDRAGAFLSQLTDGLRVRPPDILAGYGRILWGCAKKMIVADQAAVVIQSVYAEPGAHGGLQILLAAYLFSIQIYADFSGYSDIAIGAARVVGVRLQENFLLPYGATSIGDFWRRWHITLSSWFRDYVYIPMGGSRRGIARQSLAVFTVFALSGLWHGANWTFVAWGCFLGIVLILSLWTREWRAALVRMTRLDRHPRAHRLLQVVLTFHVVTFSWILFRAQSLEHAREIIGRLTQGIADPAAALALVPASLFVAILGMFAVEYRLRGSNLGGALLPLPAWLQVFLYYLLGIAILAFGYFAYQPFIYARF